GLGQARGQREAAVAHDHGRHAVPAGAAPQGVPGDLGVHVSVAVDEAGRDDEAVGVDHPLGRRAQAPHLDDAALPDAYVALIAWRARAVHDRSVADQEIEPHSRVLSLYSRGSAALEARQASLPESAEPFFVILG